jgi:hypothetical protein
VARAIPADSATSSIVALRKPFRSKTPAAAAISEEVLIALLRTIPRPPEPSAG